MNILKSCYWETRETNSLYIIFLCNSDFVILKTLAKIFSQWSEHRAWLSHQSDRTITQKCVCVCVCVCVQPQALSKGSDGYILRGGPNSLELRRRLVLPWRRRLTDWPDWLPLGVKLPTRGKFTPFAIWTGLAADKGGLPGRPRDHFTGQAGPRRSNGVLFFRNLLFHRPTTFKPKVCHREGERVTE